MKQLKNPRSKLLGMRSLLQFKIIVEKHPDTYVAYPLGIKGVVVGIMDVNRLVTFKITFLLSTFFMCGI
jgi:hypothetical protein